MEHSREEHEMCYYDDFRSLLVGFEDLEERKRRSRPKSKPKMKLQKKKTRMRVAKSCAEFKWLVLSDPVLK